MKMISKLFYIAFVVVLLSVAALFLSSLLPIPGNIKVKIVKSGSMEPAIKTGSIVVVKPASAYVIGDIITFGQDTRTRIPTTHRITAMRDDGSTVTYTVKGDANEEADPDIVSKDSVLGRVILSIPYAGYILDFARHPIGFTLLIGIPAGIIVIDETLRIWVEVRGLQRRVRRPKNTTVIDLRNAPSL